MNSSPFSLETVFRPEDAGEDKIDLELGGWEVHGLGLHPENAHAFKRSASSPPKGSEDMAWPNGSNSALYGWFFRRPEMKGKDRDKLLIRKQSLKHPKDHRRHEAPLCGGYCLFYRDKKPHPVTKKTVHRAKLVLALNWQRFIRHQPEDKNLPLRSLPRLQRRREDRTFHGEEFAMDGEDNWLPETQSWRNFAASQRIADYIKKIVSRMELDFARACKVENAAQDAFVTFKRSTERCSLSAVETFWEFPSDNPIADVLQIGAKMMHLKCAGASAKIASFPFKEANRVLNSPCFVIPIAQGVKLKLYAKTNRRIRFEIVQYGLRQQTPRLLQEAVDLTDPWKTTDAEFHSFLSTQNDFLWYKLPGVINGLRRRAAIHMEQVMSELNKGRNSPVKACSVVQLLAEIAVAVPAGFKSKAARLAEIQNLLFMLCYQRGFRGNRKQGPLSATLEALNAAGVLEFDRSRQFYVLADAYIVAADALIMATGEPLFAIFGSDVEKFKVLRGGKRPTRLRE